MYSSSVVVFYCGLVLIGLPIYPHGYCTGTWANHVYSAGLLHMNLPRNDITAKKQRQNKLSAYESGHEGVAVLQASFAIKWQKNQVTRQPHFHDLIHISLNKY